MKIKDIKIDAEYAYSKTTKPGARHHHARIRVIDLNGQTTTGYSWESGKRGATVIYLANDGEPAAGHKPFVVESRWIHWTWAEEIERLAKKAERRQRSDGRKSSNIEAWRAGGLTAALVESGVLPGKDKYDHETERWVQTGDTGDHNIGGDHIKVLLTIAQARALVVGLAWASGKAPSED